MKYNLKVSDYQGLYTIYTIQLGYSRITQIILLLLDAFLVILLFSLDIQPWSLFQDNVEMKMNQQLIQFIIWIISFIFINIIFNQIQQNKIIEGTAACPAAP